MRPAALAYQAYERARHYLRDDVAPRDLHRAALALIRDRLFRTYKPSTLAQLVKQGRREYGHAQFIELLVDYWLGLDSGTDIALPQAYAGRHDIHERFGRVVRRGIEKADRKHAEHLARLRPAK